MRSNKLAPRGRGWRGFNPNSRHSTRCESSIQRSPSPPLGPLLQTLGEADLLAAAQIESSCGKPAEIAECACVASFNWLGRDEPTVLIPGAPPAWTPLDEPRRLEEDKGDYYRDLNAARFPRYPLEPAVRTLLTEDEDFETQEVDLFACSSTLGSLLRFVRRVDKPFRFFVEAVGNTVFFTRHENSPTQLITGVKGYGHTFPETYTTWDADVKGSVSCQRLLRYEFAGLDCILRFECDGYLQSKVPGQVNVPPAASGQHTGEVSSSLAGGENHDGSLQINKAGQKIPQEAVFDLKTRAGWKKGSNVLEDELPRYWVAQIPNFILARHDYGVFDDINVRHIRDDVEKWQGENQKDLRCLGWLLREIISTTKMRKDKKLEVRCKGLDALELREQDTDEHDVLPPELKLRWMEDEPSEGKRPESDDTSTGSEAFPAAESAFSDDGLGLGLGFDSDEDSEKDYTACSADGCGYCGHCSY